MKKTRLAKKTTGKKRGEERGASWTKTVSCARRLAALASIAWFALALAVYYWNYAFALLNR